MIAIVTPEPSRPSSFCAMFAPVCWTALARSISSSPPVSDTGSDTVWTGYTAFTPGSDPSAATCAGATETEKPFHNVSNEYRSVKLMPAAAAFDLKALCSALSVASLVPFAAGGLASSTNHAVAVSLAAPPINPLSAAPAPPAAGATSIAATQSNPAASRRLLFSIPSPSLTALRRSSALLRSNADHGVSI